MIMYVRNYSCWNNILHDRSPVESDNESNTVFALLFQVFLGEPMSSINCTILQFLHVSTW